MTASDRFVLTANTFSKDNGLFQVRGAWNLAHFEPSLHININKGRRAFFCVTLVRKMGCAASNGEEETIIVEENTSDLPVITSPEILESYLQLLEDSAENDVNDVLVVENLSWACPIQASSMEDAENLTKEDGWWTADTDTAWVEIDLSKPLGRLNRKPSTVTGIRIHWAADGHAKSYKIWSSSNNGSSWEEQRSQEDAKKTDEDGLSTDENESWNGWSEMGGWMKKTTHVRFEFTDIHQEEDGSPHLGINEILVMGHEGEGYISNLDTRRLRTVKNISVDSRVSVSSNEDVTSHAGSLLTTDRYDEWHVISTETMVSFEIDFGRSVVITRLKFEWWEMCSAKRFKIFSSDDALTWKEERTETDNRLPNPNPKNEEDWNAWGIVPGWTHPTKYLKVELTEGTLDVWDENKMFALRQWVVMGYDEETPPDVLVKPPPPYKTLQKELASHLHLLIKNGDDVTQTQTTTLLQLTLMNNLGAVGWPLLDHKFARILFTNQVQLELFLSSGDCTECDDASHSTREGRWTEALRVFIRLMEHDLSAADDSFKLRLTVAIALTFSTPVHSFANDFHLYGHEGDYKANFDPLSRYDTFVDLVDRRILFETFAESNAWQMRYVVDSWCTDDELEWARQNVPETQKARNGESCVAECANDMVEYTEYNKDSVDVQDG